MLKCWGKVSASNLISRISTQQIRRDTLGCVYLIQPNPLIVDDQPLISDRSLFPSLYPKERVS